MTPFKILLTDHAISDLEGMSQEAKAQILGDIKSLEPSPFPQGSRIKRLKRFPVPVYRLRSGDYRILYLIRDEVIVLRVIDRKLLDRAIKRLKIQKL